MAGGQRAMAGGGGQGNRLGRELSPYLRQHKDNPVDWYPWGQEAIGRAVAENKLIFLSVGYSTCHWCHVMERESFECESVASVMNEHFVNIKVDREERPDVDKVYMTFVQATTGGGGWPLSVFLTPALLPVFGGTYFPPGGSYGRPGFKQVLSALAGQWREEGAEMAQQGGEVLKILESKLGPASLTPLPSLPGPGLLAKLYAQLHAAYDPKYGGFSKAPKFPQPSNLLVLLHLAGWAGEAPDRRKRSAEMVLHTLDMMDRGGIHDHVSQGFARYSTDSQWHVPHFEKMLYDQAQLVMAYTAAALLPGSPARLRAVVDDIVTYVSRDLTHPLGGFYSAEDADSLPGGADPAGPKREGAFCVWSWAEVQELLGQELVQGGAISLAEVAAHEYNLTEEGNVSPAQDPHGEMTGQNVLTRLPAVEPLLPAAEWDAALDRVRAVLGKARAQRPRPGLDTKILAGWTGLMVSGLARAGPALHQPGYTALALRAGAFLREHMVREGRLVRAVYGAGAGLGQLEGGAIHGFLEDYAFTVQACLDLYTATFGEEWLELALQLQEVQDELFHDREQGGYFVSRAGDPEIVLRLKDDQDGAEPAANSVACLNLLRLGRLLARPGLTEKGARVLRLYGARLEQLPRALPAMAEAFLFQHAAQPLLVLEAADPSSCPLLAWARALHRPGLALLAVGPEDAALARAAHPGLEGGGGGGGWLVGPGPAVVRVETVQELEAALH